eukprot:m.208493 g.208493  ORF g.208493 m.208493 type:complete len:219 (+) comp15455_c0_seq1:4794-5450(+)
MVIVRHDKEDHGDACQHRNVADCRRCNDYCIEHLSFRAKASKVNVTPNNSAQSSDPPGGIPPLSVTKHSAHLALPSTQPVIRAMQELTFVSGQESNAPSNADALEALSRVAAQLGSVEPAIIALGLDPLPIASKQSRHTGSASHLARQKVQLRSTPDTHCRTITSSSSLPVPEMHSATAPLGSLSRRVDQQDRQVSDAWHVSLASVHPGSDRHVVTRI